MEQPRTDRELVAAMKPYTQENPARSWWELLSTSVLLAGLAFVAFRSASTPLAWAGRVTASFFAGLMLVRLFIHFHDFQHRAILRRSKVARAYFWWVGILLMTPERVWCDTHNYHHANTAKIIGSHVGSFMMVTTQMWEKMTPKERFLYKAIRHPLTMLFGYFTIFGLGMCVSPMRRDPKKNWSAGFALFCHVAVTALLLMKFGFATYFFGYFMPLSIAMAVGSYLFYAQHNFPEIFVQPRDKWNFSRAALESSSFMKMGPIMNYLTGNIGFHHVHHLNSSIPFYRLPQVMSEVPELQSPPTTSLSASDLKKCFALKLWDAENGRMVGYPNG